jgi:heterodisulfide reductase subunit A-like polyferredoxin
MENSRKKVGAVLVVGGGIAGMQAALDCANSGFKVYLLEQQPAIGGNMARLDKTFPTNDCAMCMISPKLVETGRHLNIEIITYADLRRIEGEAGDFAVTINKRARFVDEEKCNGCGDCEQVCPVSIKDTFNGELSERKAIYRLYPQAIPNVFTIDKNYAPPPCRGTCPAGVNAQGYVALISKRKFLEALDVVRERMPFAGACGRVCHHPCETECNRAKLDAAVSVRNLKRFVADYEWDLIRRGESVERPPSEIVPPEKQSYTEKVAVVGGGPAGLTCAYDLAKLGYPVTVFDANAELGGMMRTGIPAYRLPREVLDHEIRLMLDEGISVQTGKVLGKDFTVVQLKAQGYESVFVATGAQLAKKIPLEGGDAADVLYGVPFLREVNAGGKPSLGSRVVVIGGGNVATDVARCARRIVGEGAVSLWCLESRPEMPAHDWEIREAEEEGIDIHPSWGPARVVRDNGKVAGIEFVRCTSVFDEDKRFNPVFDTAEKQTVKADTVILAVGQVCDLSFLEGQVQTNRGLIEVDRLTLETSLPGVFAGGDNVLGPASLVEAVEQGHRAAESIHRCLRGLAMREDREPVARPKEFADIPSWAGCACVARNPMPTADLAERATSFTEIDSGYTEEMAVAEALRCLNCGVCSVCRECVRVCKARAIDHHMKDATRHVKVGAIILTNGYDVFDARRKSEYGFGRYPNVVTSMQFERILSASGPYEGHVRRPSDGRVPKRIAWIQCVGSRDVTVGNGYCSSVCCMYATKEAVIAKEHDQNIEPTIFFIDIRAFGKGFEAFYNRAKENYGVRYVRSQISSLKENPENGNIIVRYVNETNGRKQVVEEEFDLVVLSVGLVAHHSIKDLVDIAGITCNTSGFVQGKLPLPLESNREGIFLSGAVSGPKDIPETVMESSAAAALCGELLSAARGTEVRVKEYPVERDVTGEAPRVGVFVCHCGTNIASVVDVAAVSDYVASIPGVVYAEHTVYTCSQDTQERIKEVIRDKKLNRVIVASCTPRTHESLFQETLREAGLNKFLFEMADIREQCSWVHQREPGSATEKAKALVRGSVGKSKLLEPLQFRRVGVTKAALVVGGGIAGMTASLSLARQGFDVHLVERESELGGNLRRLHESLEGYDWRRHLETAIDAVASEERIIVHLGSEIDEVSGFVGNFATRLKGASNAEIKHGVILIATGADEFQPDKFLFGVDDRVLTQRSLDEKLADGFRADTVVMIQCVGSRDAERPYCSRVCCGTAVKNALAIKRKNPGAKVYILYRDIRTYQFKEDYYREARDKGVMFIHFPDDAYPEVTSTGKGLRVAVRDTVLDETIELSADYIVLSAAVVPDKANNRRLAELMKVSVNEDGFFMEAHVKLRPVDFANEGIFVCGLAHSPKYTEENIVQALAAAGRAACILSKPSLEVGGVVSHVDPDKCATCLTCVRECVYNAPFVNADGKAEIEEAKCQGCGNCAAACPAKAIQLRTFTDAQERALFRSILHEEETRSDHMVLADR